MTKNGRFCVIAVVCLMAGGSLPAQRVAVLDIEWEHGVSYVDDLPDPSKLVTSASPVSASVRNFMTFTAMGDIVAVNGKPARGSFVNNGRVTQIFASPAPGQGIGDIGRGGTVDLHLEILQSDGTRVGSIMTSGFTGGGSPPGLPNLLHNLAITGGTGAFLGARGTLVSPPISLRSASMAEDPANRRSTGAPRGRFRAYIIPMAFPEVVTTAAGAAIFHTDFTPVTAARPARSGETLIVRATGLGPTRPGLTEGVAFPNDPLQEVNSPLEVTVNGNSAEVVNKIGWPGTTDTYRVDIRVPDGISPGVAAVKLTAAYISGPEVTVPIQ